VTTELKTMIKQTSKHQSERRTISFIKF